jgi:tetratricopeptide (TPR) repeat protein
MNYVGKAMKTMLLAGAMFFGSGVARVDAAPEKPWVASTSYRQFISNALSAHSEKDYSSAADWYLKAAEIASESEERARAYFRAGEMFDRGGDVVHAKELFEKVAEMKLEDDYYISKAKLALRAYDMAEVKHIKPWRCSAIYSGGSAPEITVDGKTYPYDEYDRKLIKNLGKAHPYYARDEVCKRLKFISFGKIDMKYDTGFQHVDSNVNRLETDGDESFVADFECFDDRGKSFKFVVAKYSRDLILLYYHAPEELNPVPSGIFEGFPFYFGDAFDFKSGERKVVYGNVATVPIVIDEDLSENEKREKLINDSIKAIAESFEAELAFYKERGMFKGDVPSADDPKAFIGAVAKDKEALRLLKRTFAEVVPYNPFAEPEFEYDLLAQYYKQTGKPAVVPTGKKVIKCNYHAGFLLDILLVIIRVLLNWNGWMMIKLSSSARMIEKTDMMFLLIYLI